MREHESLPEMGWEQQVVAGCYERAEYLEELINKAQDVDTVKQLYAEIMPSIEKDFPFYGQPVYISGRGIHPIFDEDGTSVLGEGWQTSEGDVGFHKGFAIVHDDDNDKPYRILHKIFTGEGYGSPLATVERETRVYKYFLLDSPLVPIIELEAALSSHEFSDTEFTDRLELVNKYSREFVTMLRSTTFRRLQHKRQRRVVDDFLLEVESKASVRDLQFMGEPQYAYVPILMGNTKFFKPVSLERYVVNGTCLGVDTVETGKLSLKAIRKDADLGDKWCGLCIVIDPDDDTRRGLSLGEEQVLYIPTNDQTFDALLYEEAS